MLVVKAGVGGREMLTYYDDVSGRKRVKRRFVWAIWAFAAGIAAGALVAHL